MAQEVVDIYDSDSFSEDSFDGDLEYDEFEGGKSPKHSKFPTTEEIRPKSPKSPKHEIITVIKAEDIQPPPVSTTTLPVHVIAPTPSPCQPCAVRTTEIEDDVTTEEEDEDEESDDDTKSETSTIDALSKDPLFLVLSEYLSNDKGNIVDALFKINKSLKQIIKLMQK